MQTNQFEQLIQDLYQTDQVQALKQIHEVNDFHSEESAFVHTQEVEQRIQDILKFDFVQDPDAKSRLQDYVSEKVGNLTRAELLRVSAVLHDIGKAMSFTDKDGLEQTIFQTKEDGKTSAYEHAKYGAQKVYDILCGLSDADRQYVADIVRLHMEPLNLERDLSGSDEKNYLNQLKRFQNKIGVGYIDILLIGAADTAKDDDIHFMVFGKEYNGSINLLKGLIAQSMDVNQVSGSIDTLKRYLDDRKVNAAVYMSNPEKVEAELENSFSAEFKVKVDAGIMSQEKATSIAKGKIKSTLAKIGFDEPPTDYKAFSGKTIVYYTIE